MKTRGRPVGFKVSEATKEKIRQFNIGRRQSAETKLKNRIAHLGKSSGMKGKRAWNKQMTKEEIAGRLKPNTCEICGSGNKICFDHCHKTGKFRGWICVNCNVALGQVKDSKETLQKLIDYLTFNEMFYQQKQGNEKLSTNALPQ